MIRFFKNRKWAVAIATLLVVLLGPWIISRLASQGRRLQSFKLSNEYTKESDRPIRVACYNIAHGRGLAESNWKGGDAAARLARLDAICELLKEIDADVVVLNEVDFDTSWSNNVNQAEYIARKTGYPFGVEERNLDFRVLHRTWKFGNAILSRFPISNERVVDLPSFAEIETLCAGEKRGVACDVHKGEQTFSIFGLHLSHRSEEVRERSVQKVLENVRSSQHPCIILGDTNSTSPGLPQSNLTKEGKNAIQSFDESCILTRNKPSIPVAESELTFRSDKPRSIIDWILISDSLEFHSYEVRSSTLSDHLPVIADIDLK